MHNPVPEWENDWKLSKIDLHKACSIKGDEKWIHILELLPYSENSLVKDLISSSCVAMIKSDIYLYCKASHDIQSVTIFWLLLICDMSKMYSVNIDKYCCWWFNFVGFKTWEARYSGLSVK